MKTLKIINIDLFLLGGILTAFIYFLIFQLTLLKKIDFKNRVSAFKNISVLFWLKILIMKKNNVSQTKSVQFFYGWTSDWMMERVKSSLFIVLEISYRKQEYQVNQLRKIKKIT